MDQFAVKELFDLPCPVARLLDLPRVLWIADEIPQSAYAGGILLKRLFSGYPVERLLVVGHSHRHTRRHNFCLFAMSG